MKRPAIALLAVLLVATMIAAAPADEAPARVRVKVFPGIANLPIFAAISHGVFDRHGVAVQLLFTANSDEQRAGLANGDFEIAHAAVDNAVHMVEVAGVDAVIVAGGDSSMNELIVQPDIRAVRDLKGATVAVDALNTAYALQLRKILLGHGLHVDRDYTMKAIGATGQRLKIMQEDRTYKAAMMNPPFSVLAQRAGLKSLGRAVDLIGPYQGGGAFVLRAWARGHAAVLERYLAAYVEGLRWVLAPANRDAAVKLLAERLKLPTDVAARSLEIATDPRGGLAPDARFDMAGFKNVLALRAELEHGWGGTPPTPDKYVDLSYYERALARVR
jgi:ABC-type nitrate/sulfonate/bicarbonate transport system substrate-binding protein